MKFHVLMLVWLMIIFHLLDISSGEEASEQMSARIKKSIGEPDQNVPINQYFSAINSAHPRDCYEIGMKYSPWKLMSGLYEIQPNEYQTAFHVYCDFDTDHGGWTVFQRRIDGSVDFNRNWNEYKNGFGYLTTEFWLGNQKLADITAQKKYELRIELANKFGDSYYVKYSSFRIGHQNTYYKIMLGQFSGNTSADSLDYHRNQKFSTYDADHDTSTGENCASVHGGGWWFNRCDNANLNGPFGVDSDSGPGGIEWSNLPRGCCALQFSEMKIRPLS